MADIRYHRYQAIIELDAHYEGSSEFVKATIEYRASSQNSAERIAQTYAAQFYGARVDAVNQMD